MKLYISKDKIETFCGNVFSLRLVSEYRVLSSLDGISYTPCAKGCIRAFGGETEIYFDRPCKARLIRFEVFETVGSKSGDKKYTGIPAVLGEISVFEARKLYRKRYSFVFTALQESLRHLYRA